MLFVIDPKIHIFLRFVAAFIVAPILIWKGYTYKDNLILLNGIWTFIVDSFTFYKSYENKNKYNLS